MAFFLAMAAGSAVGTVMGGVALNVVPSALLVPLLGVLLVLSSFRVWRHE
jgi:uncharacterized protein